MRKEKEIPLPELDKILGWISHFDKAVILNSNTSQQVFSDPYSKFDLLIAVGDSKRFKASSDIFQSVKDFQTEENDWLFGYFGYDLKNELEQLSSNNPDHTQFEKSFWFCPRFVITVKNSQCKVCFFEEDEKLLTDVLNRSETINFLSTSSERLNIKHRVSRESYIDAVTGLQKHIFRGDIYEVNYCMEFYSENAEINPYATYKNLNEFSPMPFSCFIKNEKQFIISASPERFLAGRKNKMISQPIKGTIRRGKDEQEDGILKNELLSNKKEQMENVMIVDLVRNDLSQTAKPKSVQVEELFGIKTFRRLHQMISTVVSEKDEKYHPTEVIRSCFPMGSMTGAPKISAMKLIDKFESTSRNVYSGAAGYFSPEGDFDLNVIIRTILYNEETHYVSFSAGSAITAKAEASKEYDECLLKASGMMKILSPEK